MLGVIESTLIYHGAAVSSLWCPKLKLIIVMIEKDGVTRILESELFPHLQPIYLPTSEASLAFF